MNYKKELKKIYSAPPPDYSGLIEREIFLYGAGSLGAMACDLLQRTELRPKYLVDKTKKGQINETVIISPDEISYSDRKNALCLVCIATISYNEIINSLYGLGIKNILHFYTYAHLKFPQLLSNGWTCNNPSSKDKQEIENVCELLAHDTQSLYHYLQFLWWKLRGVEYIYPDFPVLSGQKYFLAPCMPKLSDNEVLLDAGCHHGQAIEKFIHATQNNFKKIYAFEPDPEHLEICRKKFDDVRIFYSPKGISSKNEITRFESGLGFASKINENGAQPIEIITIDDLDIVPTIIKLHIEGEELNALIGAKKTIQKNKPVLMVLADHNIDGLYTIANFLRGLEGYKIFFNLHDYCGNTAVLYAIPQNSSTKD